MCSDPLCQTCDEMAWLYAHPLGPFNGRPDIPSGLGVEPVGTLTESTRSQSDDYDTIWRLGYATL